VPWRPDLGDHHDIIPQARIWLTMSRDGLMPSSSQVHPRFRTPHISTAITGVLAATFAGCCRSASLVNWFRSAR